MRKAIVFLSILAGFLSGSLFAQTPEIEWGAKFDIDRDYQYDRIVGQDDEKIFIIKKEKTKELGKSNIWLESISKLTMGIESSYKLEMPKIHSKKSNFENLYFIDGKLILFVTVHDQMKKISSLYMMHIDEDGITKGEPQMLTFMALIVDPEAGFKFSLTSDKKFVIVHYHIMFSTYTGEPLYFKMINSDLNVVESKRFEFPYIKSKLKLINYERGESGNYYFAIQTEPTKGKKSRRGGRAARISYNYSILVYNAKKDSLQDYKISVKKFNPSSLMMTISENEDVLAFGFGTRRSSSAYSGVYFQRIDPRTEKFIVKNFLDFSKDRTFLAEFKQERNGTNESQWYSFTPGQVVQRDNGGFVYLTEQCYTEKEVIRDPKTKKETSAYFHHYNDILAISVDDENNMEWFRRIPKNQYSTNDKGYYSSFTVKPVMNKLKILYNDHSKNLKNKNLEKIKELRNNIATNPSGQAIVATVYSDGNIDKAIMFEGSDSKYTICPKLFIDSDPQFFIYAQKGSKFKIGNFFFE